MLLLFGNRSEVDKAKRILKEESADSSDDNREGFITTSPLDYHLFRQEITSKYPTYSPPPPLLPIEPENNTMLPPLPNHPSRQTSHDDLNTVSNSGAVGGSIFNQPVHIATPAPSPPPSPAGPGGKGAKKQNYQTNQNFPFLYPPLDASSSTVGADGRLELQDKMSNHRWQDGNVPASILEAGQLFASRMRMSRSLRQLWDVRERYIKEERGWGDILDDKDHDNDEKHDPVDDDDDDSLLDSPECVEKKQLPRGTAGVEQKYKSTEETSNEKIQEQLDAVDIYYVSVSPFCLY